MKIKTPYTLAAIFAVSVFASGCSQMAAQQAAPAPEAKPAAPKTIVDCSKCHKPAPAPAATPAGGAHTHPAIPGCTNSTTHTHPFTNAKHQHAYSCKGGKKTVTKRVVKQTKKTAVANKWAHTHPAIPGCTDSITHTHPYNNANHSHHYSCKGGQKQQHIVVPQVKAKGNFKGPVQIDTGVMQTYKKP
ncbi:hypothetical protein [uncultured Thiothrix sp.]|jgi:transposase-like protein|uniref:hypothetical protein n=1 Tax=uncultured Thiothrix sp. TaxID=223185 RepID=UPI00261A2BD1|nr:hypothetical protein [uncultured Thiothrix sp.]HMT91856.1 hypothetical protein [Thiolinea sp.]